MTRLSSAEADRAARSIVNCGAKLVFGERRNALSSALARVACEPWLAVEIAAAVDAGDPSILPDGWGLFVEYGRMDLSVLPLGEERPPAKSPEGLFIELKLLTALENFGAQKKSLEKDHEKLKAIGSRHSYEVTLLFDVEEPIVPTCRWKRPVRGKPKSLEQAFLEVQGASLFLEHMNLWGPVPLEHAWCRGAARLDLWKHRFS